MGTAAGSSIWSVDISAVSEFSSLNISLAVLQ